MIFSTLPVAAVSAAAVVAAAVAAVAAVVAAVLAAVAAVVSTRPYCQKRCSPLECQALESAPAVDCCSGFG